MSRTLFNALSLAGLIVLGFTCAYAQQDENLMGLSGVGLDVSWTGAAEADRATIQTAVELKMRQAGLHILSDSEREQTPGHPVLFIHVDGVGTAVPVSLILSERVRLAREAIGDATTWLMYGVARSSKPESARDIIARYEKQYAMQAPSVQHMLELEIQAAIEAAKQAVTVSTVRDAIATYVDSFLNAWAKENTKPLTHEHGPTQFVAPEH